MILDEIVEYKRGEVASRQASADINELRAVAAAMPACRGFANALRNNKQGLRRTSLAARTLPSISPSTPRLIAEIKERSPSKGAIREGLDPVQIAKDYSEGGASCISVLTDSKYFGGAMERIAAVRKAVPIPVLQKDFIVDPFQIIEARAAGADCILLIVAALEKGVLKALYDQAVEVGLDVLVESHTAEELEFAISSGFELVGINNRNLNTFEVSLSTTIQLAKAVPEDRVLVGESGIFARPDVDQLAEAGVDAILVGEALMSSDNICAKVRELTS